MCRDDRPGVVPNPLPTPSPMLPYVAALDPGLLILAPVPGITAVLPRFLGLP